MLNSKDKESLIKLGILIGSFILIFSILLIMTIFSRSSWEKGLRTSVLEVLESYSPNTYISADFVKIYSNLSVSAAVYELKKTVTTSEKDFAVIIRIPTIVGPEPAVFICNSKTVNFVQITNQFVIDKTEIEFYGEHQLAINKPISFTLFFTLSFNPYSANKISVV